MLGEDYKNLFILLTGSLATDVETPGVIILPSPEDDNRKNSGQQQLFMFLKNQPCLFYLWESSDSRM